jgi:hypothetical protein
MPEHGMSREDADELVRDLEAAGVQGSSKCRTR